MIPPKIANLCLNKNGAISALTVAACREQHEAAAFTNPSRRVVGYGDLSRPSSRTYFTETRATPLLPSYKPPCLARRPKQDSFSPCCSCAPSAERLERERKQARRRSEQAGGCPGVGRGRWRADLKRIDSFFGCVSSGIFFYGLGAGRRSGAPRGSVRNASVRPARAIDHAAGISPSASSAWPSLSSVFLLTFAVTLDRENT